MYRLDDGRQRHGTGDDPWGAPWADTDDCGYESDEDCARAFAASREDSGCYLDEYDL